MAVEDQGVKRMAKEVRNAWSDHPVYTFWGDKGIRPWLKYTTVVAIIVTVLMYALQSKFLLGTFLTAIWGTLAIVFVIWLWVRAREELAKSEGWGQARMDEHD